MKYHYNSDNLLSKRECSLGSDIIYNYNNDGLLIETTKDENFKLYFYYNGLLTKTYNYNEVTEYYYYNKVGLLVKYLKIWFEARRIAYYKYSKNNQLISVEKNVSNGVTEKFTLRIKDNKRNMYVLPFLTFNQKYYGNIE